MSISAKSIERWKGELETNERLLVTGGQRFHWLRLLYVRVYRFFLSRYEDELSHVRTDNCECDGQAWR